MGSLGSIVSSTHFQVKEGQILVVLSLYVCCTHFAAKSEDAVCALYVRGKYIALTAIPPPPLRVVAITGSTCGQETFYFLT